VKTSRRIARTLICRDEHGYECWIEPNETTPLLVIGNKDATHSIILTATRAAAIRSALFRALLRRHDAAEAPRAKRGKGSR
jgi:hypothetical protein